MQVFEHNYGTFDNHDGDDHLCQEQWERWIAKPGISPSYIGQNEVTGIKQNSQRRQPEAEGVGTVA